MYGESHRSYAGLCFGGHYGVVREKNRFLCQTLQAKHYYNRINEHTGAKYDVPKPTRVTSELLEPGFLPWRRALEAITQIHEAFTECPGDFKPELLDIFPLYGDFKFVQRSTGTEIIVEIKSRQCEWELNSGEPYMRHHQYAIGFEGRHIFSWKTQWDFLLTKHEDAQTQALFLPRDLIPVSWWNADPTSPDKKLAWPSDAVGVLKDYVVDLTSNSRLVADIESIFHLTETDRTSVKAVNSIPEAPYQFVRQPKAPGTQDEPGGTDDPPEIVPLNTDYWRPRKWTSSSYQRGFGSSLHEDCRGNTYEVWAKEALWELCRARSVFARRNRNTI